MLSVEQVRSSKGLQWLSLFRDDHVSLHPRFFHDLKATRDTREFQWPHD